MVVAWPKKKIFLAKINWFWIFMSTWIILFAQLKITFTIRDHVVVWSLSHVWLFCDPMDCSLPGSSVQGFSRQEYRSGLQFPSPGYLPRPLQSCDCSRVGVLSFLSSLRARQLTAGSGCNYWQLWHLCCICKWILHHWLTREAQEIIYWPSFG